MRPSRTLGNLALEWPPPTLRRPAGALWSSIEEAEDIVLGSVETREDTPRGAFGREPGALSTLSLRAHETWKGRPRSTLTFTADPDLVSSSPDGSEELVLVFLLDGGPRALGMATAHALLPLSSDEVADHREAVVEALVLQSRPDHGDENRLEWLVRRACRPGTRWHGLLDLLASGAEPRLADRLSPAQLDRIAAGLRGDG